LSGEEDEEARRARAIDLLEANHTFPGDYTFSVVARNEQEVATAVLAAIEGALGRPLPPGSVDRRESAQGRYVSHRVTVTCLRADEVLAIYARVRTVDGVVSVL
jgi:putative lipoic acid-binding regulatory protein